MRRPKFRGPESDLSKRLKLKPKADGLTVSREWIEAFGFVVTAPSGKITLSYIPSPKQLDFHEATEPNVIIEGSRGTGKSVCIRNDAHQRALAYPNYNYLIIRRTMPELKKSHLRFIEAEMIAMGGSFNKTDSIAYYPNGSTGYYAQCEDEAAMLKLLSSEYCAIYFDEITTFTADQIVKISSCCRVPEDSGLLAIIRGGTNPLGTGADYVRRAWIVKDITPDEDPDYDPNDYRAIHTTLDDNPYIDKAQYIKQLSKLPEHIRKAWLDGIWIIEGAYFHDYLPTKDNKPWHVIQIYPRIRDQQAHMHDWVRLYRALDWGFSPDPAVCLWFAILPTTRVIVLKERVWRSKTAAHVAKCIKIESEKMRVAETFCDPTMFYGSEATGNMSIGDIFESNGISLTPVKNDRVQAGYAIHEYLNTILDDGLPRLQFYGPESPMLVKTLADMRTDKNNPARIADHKDDHWTIALAYYCMQWTGSSKDPTEVTTEQYARRLGVAPQGFSNKRTRLGSESVRGMSGRYRS